MDFFLDVSIPAAFEMAHSLYFEGTRKLERL
jgi:hypothetical protein